MKLKVGLGQMNSRDNKKINLAAAEKMIDDLSAAGAELVSLPECSLFLGEPDRFPDNAEPLNGPSMSRFREKARAHGIYLHPGSFPESDGRKIYNTTVVIDPQGGIIATYRKIHLFDVTLSDGTRYCESETISPGDRVATVEIDGVVFGLSICYDLRFPELYRRQAELGAHVFLIPAAFTLQTGRDHWEILLRARAVENQAWVIAAAQWGVHPKEKQSYGRSMIVDPWGLVVARAVDGVSLVTYELDLERIHRTRAVMPALDHRRKDIFQP